VGVLEVIGAIAMIVGCLFALTGSLGVLRMPDFYSRMHPAGKSDTLAQALILFGLALLATQQLVDLIGSDGGDHADTVIGVLNIILKLGLLSAILFLTAPTSTHAIAKAARLDIYTDIPIAGDPGSSRIAEIVIPGDIEERLQEEETPVFNVDDHRPEPDAPLEGKGKGEGEGEEE